MEVVRIPGLPQVGEVDVLARGLAVEHRRAASAGDVEVRVGHADGEFLEMVAVDVGHRGHGGPGVGVGLEALVAAADRRVRRRVRRVVGVAAVVELRGRDVARRARAEDGVHDARADPVGAVPHGRADADVGPSVAVEVAAGDGEPEQLAAVAGDRERGGGDVHGGGGGRERAGAAEEDVDDAGVGAGGIRVRHTHGVVLEPVAVDVAEHRDGRARGVRRRVAVGRQAGRRQRADSDAAREHAEPDDRRRQSERLAWMPQNPSPAHVPPQLPFVYDPTAFVIAQSADALGCSTSITRSS